MKQTVRFELQMTASTKEKLDAMAKAAGQSCSAIVRLLIDGAAIREMPHADFHAMTAELYRIGVNLNQLAHVANATGKIDSGAYAQVAAELRTAILDIKRAVYLR